MPAASTDALGMEVPIGRIEAEFKKLWEADAASTKASLVNFAVYCEQPDTLVENTRVVSEITRTHACRAILISADIDAPESSARAWITAHCNLVGGRKSVCSEQIAFQLDGKAIGRIRNVVFAHLLSDLPLILWWQGPFSRIFEPRFYNLLDRLIIDSADWPDVAAGLARLQDALDNATRGLIPHDLSWSRTQLLRGAVAALFDDPLACAELRRLDAVSIHHHPDRRTTALYVAAWLATRLGWSPAGNTRGNEIVFSAEDGGRQIACHLKPTDPAAPPVSVVLLESPSSKFLIEHETGSAFLRSSAAVGGHRSEQLTPADVDEPAALVNGTLARSGNNSLYLDVLPAFRKLV